MPQVEKEVRLYRGLLLFVGAIYLLWWLAVEVILPRAFNPFPSRAGVVLFIWGVVAASFFSAVIRHHLRILWACALWLVTAHYYYLLYENAGDINWIVGSFITVSAITLGLLSRATLISYSVFAGALSVGVVILLPSLRESVFLPGLVTVLLQSNIGLQSRLSVLRDLDASQVALRQANEALERSNLELQRFAYVASHDLQTPLRSIASFVDLLQSTYDQSFDAQAKDWLVRTSQSVKQLQTLIQDLLDYSRVDAQPRPFERISLRVVLDRALALLDAAMREANAEVVAGDLPAVSGDSSQLVQLLLNLIGNAIKYRGSEAPRIQITAEERGSEWMVGVRDNGIGIAPQHHQRVFEIFKRLHDAKEYPGTGIGLALCRRVVQHHGGRIWLESEAGKGSVFYFTVPKGVVIPHV